MTQGRKSHGLEGRLAPAWIDGHSRSGGKPPFCIDRRHRLQVFGDMVYTFNRLYLTAERSRRYALENQFCHVTTSRVRFIS